MTSHKLHSVQQYFDPENGWCGWCVGIDDIIKSTVFAELLRVLRKAKTTVHKSVACRATFSSDFEWAFAAH